MGVMWHHETVCRRISFNPGEYWVNDSVYVDPAIECSFLYFYQLLIIIGLLWMFLLHCSDKLYIHEWDIC